jgi:molybdopterin synthase catalytic subunit
MIDIKITPERINISECIEHSMSPNSGGINIFIGTVRSHTKGKKVVRLEYECYERMAIKELEKIACRIEEHYEADKILIHHRTGVLDIGETAVLIIVSCAHRDEAFKACRYAIDTLKETVPIWKKEIFEDGETWVSSTP